MRNHLIIPRVRIFKSVNDRATLQTIETELNGESEVCSPCDSCFGAERCLYGVPRILVDILQLNATLYIAMVDNAFAACVAVQTLSTGERPCPGISHSTGRPSVLIHTLCTHRNERGKGTGGCIIRHILQKYSSRGDVYLTVRPPKGETTVAVCKRAARTELNSRYKLLLSFYKNNGFRLVKRQDDMELYILETARCT